MTVTDKQMNEQAKLWNTHRSRLIGWLMKRSFSRADAEDLTQDILIKAWNRREQLNDSQSLQSWLYAIARTTMIDHLRKHQTPPAETQNDENDEDILQGLENCVEPFINDLSEQDQHLLRHIDLGTYSQKSYAAEFDVNYSTLKSRLQKARGALASRYKKCCHFQKDHRGSITDFEKKKSDCEC